MLLTFHPISTIYPLEILFLYWGGALDRMVINVNVERHVVVFFICAIYGVIDKRQNNDNILDIDILIEYKRHK